IIVCCLTYTFSIQKNGTFIRYTIVATLVCGGDLSFNLSAGFTFQTFIITSKNRKTLYGCYLLCASQMELCLSASTTFNQQVYVCLPRFLHRRTYVYRC